MRFIAIIPAISFLCVACPGEDEARDASEPAEAGVRAEGGVARDATFEDAAENPDADETFPDAEVHPDAEAHPDARILDAATPDTGCDAPDVGAGCTDRTRECQINQYCCGETDSPYADPASCPAVPDSCDRIYPGQCFDMPAPEPWCHTCTGAPGECNSGFVPGFNVDPDINMGMPFQEQELCVPISETLAVCGVTCDPSRTDNQCPRGWVCRAITPGCYQSSDCGGLECIGGDTTVMPPRPGRCKCGEGAMATGVCPAMYPVGTAGPAYLPEPVQNPRCVDIGNTGLDMYCVASYQCVPPADRPGLYPAACGF